MRLVGEDGAVAHFVLLHLFDGLVGLGHGEGFGGGFDAVAGGDVEHFADLCGLPMGLPVMVRIPEMSGKACNEPGEGGTPTKQSVPVGRRAWM